MVHTMYSSPPLHGACLVQEILTAPDLRKQWLPDVELIVDRIIAMRTQLRAGIEGAGKKNSWRHIADQIASASPTSIERTRRPQYLH
ncbi:aspartate aminotransferase, mitochondrial-like [Epargyreus clarus]|uniref:aspartate aminotransferase, mitochondrial-like n=1 Tax=Epargyreus clarus TaxID=520877 RepID=UPI003C30630B